MKSVICLFAAVLSVAACGSVDSEIDDLTSASGKARRISWEGFVYVPAGASDDVAKAAARKQIKSAIGALRKPEIGIQDREALTGVTLKGREPLAVIDDSGVQRGAIERVRYRYEDNAIVRKGSTATQIQVPLMFGDYVARANEIAPACSDDPHGAPDSLWYHFMPQLASCTQAMKQELDAINLATAKLADSARQLAKIDAERRWVTVRASLAPIKDPPPLYPEYDRLWGFGSDRQLLVAYAFFGVDADERNSRDNSLIEYARFLRTLRAKYPKLSVTLTKPHALLLDFDVGGHFTASYEDVFRWVIDDTGFPANVGTDAAKRETLKQQVIDKLAERWIYWQLAVRVRRGNESRDMTVELRSFWGYEDGTPERRQQARWRYLEAMWHGDVFLYQGHSHFGHGPLEPTGYTSANFPSDRYQTMLVNSCLSFNYYDVDFLTMHPGGTRNLDVTVNGLPAYWTMLGQASANWLIGQIDGGNKTWGDILASMKVKPSWAPAGYDPLRVVNGELDNAYKPGSAPVTVELR
jgi:hypothetical protein